MFRDHLSEVIAHYRALIDEGRFEDVDDALYNRRWMVAEGVPPVKESIATKALELFENLYEAVVRRDRGSSMAALERIEAWLHNIGV